MSEPWEAETHSPAIWIVWVGIFLPYAARIPGALLKGPEWLTSFLPDLLAFGFCSALNALCWGSIVLAVRSYSRPVSAWFPAVFGFAFPAFVYATLDLKSSSTAAIALATAPIYSLPLVFVGWLIGRRFDRKPARCEPTLR